MDGDKYRISPRVLVTTYLFFDRATGLCTIPGLSEEKVPITQGNRTSVVLSRKVLSNNPSPVYNLMGSFLSEFPKTSEGLGS